MLLKAVFRDGLIFNSFKLSPMAYRFCKDCKGGLFKKARKNGNIIKCKTCKGKGYLKVNRTINVPENPSQPDTS